MHKLSPDRKLYLLRQNRQSKESFSSASLLNSSKAGITPKQMPQHAASYGPSRAGQLLPKLTPQFTGDSGLMKRFSIMSWGSNSPTTPTVSSEISYTSEPFDGGHVKPAAKAEVEEIQPLQPQNTGSLWSSWWTSSGGEKASRTDDKVIGPEEKSQDWYVEGIRHAKSSEMKVTKHLISLRVQLSTVKLTWIEDFLNKSKGLDALGALLAELVGKGGKRKPLTEVEGMMLLEVVKCLRVLLNTEVCRPLYMMRRLFFLNLHLIAWFQSCSLFADPNHTYRLYATHRIYQTEDSYSRSSRSNLRPLSYSRPQARLVSYVRLSHSI